MRNKFHASSKRNLMLGISALALTAASTVVSAQEAAEATDEVVVTGIRASLERSLDIKRNSKGIVDAISAEDMGKFPDSNLAESLQRVTGVSIDRENGEGATVTVRGFGADYNLVTFNGRQMPTSTLGGGSDAPSTRSFDFGNLAPEAVAGVDIYKTGRASVPSGGIGSLINIRTTRPLEAPGFQATVSHKYVDDTSHNGDEATGEISALIMNTFMDDRLGLSLTAVSQDRKHSVNHYHSEYNDYIAGDTASPIDDDADTTVNMPGANQLFSYPVTARYVTKDFDQTRENFQLTAQYDVNDAIRATVDYTFAERDFKMDGNHVSIWFDHGTVNSAWGSESPVASIIYYEEVFDKNADAKSDLAMGVYSTNNVNETESTGFNLEYDVNDRLSLVLDFHDSTAESRPDSPFGSENVIESAAMVIRSQKVDYTTELPVISIVPHSTTPDIFDVGPRNATGSVLHNAYYKSEIQQAQLDGSYELNHDYIDSLDFGFSSLENKIRSAYGNLQADNWGGVAEDPTTIPNETFGEQYSLPPLFEGLGGANQILDKYNQINFGSLLSYLKNVPSHLVGSQIPVCKGDPDCVADYTIDRRITEETTSWYVQGSKDFEISNMPASIVAGVRFEETDVTSEALTPTPVRLEWTGANELSLVREGGVTNRVTSSYDHVLPSIDFDMDVRDDVKVRASYSTTITRPSFASMQSGQTFSNIWRPNMDGVTPYNGEVGEGNAALDPYESDNLDLSIEYYYGDASYASAGYFEKTVSNWIGDTSTDIVTGTGERVLGIPILNPADGPRQQQCVDDGVLLNNEDIRDCLIDLGTNPPTGEAGDNPAVVRLTRPVTSDKEQTLDGIELAWQHELSTLPGTNIDLDGFGFIVNYTIVDGDAEYDNSKPSSAGSQFALIGLSDSANLVAYYDKNGLSARVAYNWRDTFLNYAGKTSGYTDEYEQVDVNISYEIPNTNIVLSYDGINLNEENRRVFQRNNPSYVTFVSPGRARHYFGARYSF